MTGSLEESHYEVVKENALSDQRLLSDFSGTSSATTIAVVSQPGDTGIDEYCDEHEPILGMPEKHLKRYHKYKASFVTNSAVSNPAKRAYNEARLDYHYRRHLQTSDEAQNALSRLVSRLNDGESITLVCFEDASEPCHRHYLKDLIESRLSSDFSFTSKKATSG